MRILLLVFFVIAFNMNEEKEPIDQIDELPFTVNRKEFSPLRQLIDFKLQASLEKKLYSNPKWKSLINSKKMAVGVVDIKDPYNIRFARVNGNEMMYAASLPKIAVLLASEQAFEDGDLIETDELKEDMKQMITKSDNAASTRMIDRLGYKKIEQVLTDPRYNLYDEQNGGGLWVGKRYASDGPRYPDPILGLSHSATVSQVCRFYYLLAFGKLVSYDRSVEMLDIMVDSHLHHKFVNSIVKIDSSAKYYRKSGTWQNFHSDSILVWGNEWRRYILVALIEDPKGETIIRNLLPEVEQILMPKLN